jgi:hypothetical protein
MALFVGKDGSIRIGANVIGSIDKFDLTLTEATPEVSAFGDTNGVRQYASAIHSWSGTASGTFDRADAQQNTLALNFETSQIPAVAALQLYWSPGAYWSGNAWVTDMTVNSKVDDKVNVSFNFIGNGTLSASTSS